MTKVKALVDVMVQLEEELHFYSRALCIQKIFLDGSLSVKICQTHKCLLCSVL